MKSHRSDIALVTVTYNSGAVIDSFLDSLKDHGGNEALLLYAVDNASTDLTCQKLEAFSNNHPVRLIQNSSNHGVAVGNNQGIAEALENGFEWILLINNDTYFEPGSIDNLLSEARKWNALIIAPHIEAEDPPHSVWYVDASMSSWKGMKVRHLRMGQPIASEQVAARRVQYASTCALLVHRKVFESIGLMDPQYFVYGDDVDFCIRAKLAGYEFTSSGAALISHKASSLTGEFVGPFAVRWITRNWVLSCRKHATGVKQMAGMAYILLWIFGRLVLRAESLSVTKGRLRAFKEGRSVRIEAPPTVQTWPQSYAAWSKVWSGS